MSIVTIQVSNKLEPVEVQTWLASHPDSTIMSVSVEDDRFYIIYE